MKQKTGWFIGILVLVFALPAFLLMSRNQQEETKEKTAIRIGILLYRSDDTFINNIRQALEEQAKEYERASGIKVILSIEDGKESQITQNNQAERLISLGYDALCVNVVDRSAASGIIELAMRENVPLVFFNREPVSEDIRLWERVYYVGADAKESAVLQGNIVADLYRRFPERIDLNQDGVIKYVLLEGETSHQDSLIRTEWSVQTLKESDLPLEKLTAGIANWERSQGSALMEQWLKQYPGEIELVISNNDDMALGAIDAIERLNYVEKINIVGIDGTPQGIAALDQGKLLGTVQSDRKEYAGAIFTIAAALARDENPEEKISLTNDRYYWCTQNALTNQRNFIDKRKKTYGILLKKTI